MSRMDFPDSYRFEFELELEVGSALKFSAGDLCALVVDALLDVDERGELFPGITTPDSPDRLRSARMRAISYTRTAVRVLSTRDILS